MDDASDDALRTTAVAIRGIVAKRCACAFCHNGSRGHDPDVVVALFCCGGHATAADAAVVVHTKYRARRRAQCVTDCTSDTRRAGQRRRNLTNCCRRRVRRRGPFFPMMSAMTDRSCRGRFPAGERALTRRREIVTGRVGERLPARTHSGRLATRHRYAFLTLPRYSMIALTSAVEPLRMANRLCRRGRLRVVDREPRRRARRREQRPRRSRRRCRSARWARSTSCSSAAASTSSDAVIARSPRRAAPARAAPASPLGSLCTGGYALAKAGLLDKYRAAIHWENMSALREEFPRIDFTDAALRDRPRPLHVLGRHRAARPDAQPDQGRPRAATSRR